MAKTTTIKIDFIDDTENSTVSKMTIGEHSMFIIEDGFRETKEYANTRIPGGEYKLRKKTDGRFFARHKARWGHKFICEIMGVPNFTAVLFHCGNTVKHTAGCLLVNNGAQYHPSEDIYKGMDSRSPYQFFYDWVEKAFQKGDVWISINRH